MEKLKENNLENKKEKNILEKTEIWNKVSEILDFSEIILDLEKSFLVPKIKLNLNENLVLKVLSQIGEQKFRKMFINETYNKNIFFMWDEIFSYLDFWKIDENADLIAILIEKNSLSEKDFHDKTRWKVKEKLFFPNCAILDTAQFYSYEKLQKLLPETEIIFWDEEKIKEKTASDTVKVDTEWFIDFKWNNVLNFCILKLLETEPDFEKVHVLNEIFEKIDKKIFVWWSTFAMPFAIPDDFQVINFPKTKKNKEKPVLKSGILLNSMWYLNSAFYAENVKWAFVSDSHNIWEPLHSWKLTVINNKLENRFNHNWLLSYFGEKSDLILYTDWNRDELVDFLSISDEELERRTSRFKKDYKEKIIPLVYWLFYKFLEQNKFLK